MVEGHSEVWLCRDPGSEGCLCSEGAGWLTRALEFYRPEGEKLLSFPNVKMQLLYNCVIQLGLQKPRPPVKGANFAKGKLPHGQTDRRYSQRNSRPVLSSVPPDG